MSSDMPPLQMPDSFAPTSHNTQALRSALGRFATGVTIITCDCDQGPLGITANSFSSVSLDPPLVLWAPAKSSKRFDAFAQADHFAIHVLSAEQSALCSGFAKNGSAFDGFDWHTNAQNVPLISHCLARFECSRHAVHDAGDHAIVVGRVERVNTQDGAPLGFFAGQFGTFSAAP